MTSQPRVLALFGTRVIFGAERDSMEALAALQAEGCDVLCIVRHESWNDHVPKALAARGLRSEGVPHIDGWLRGWRLRTLFRNPVVFIRSNWRLWRVAQRYKPTHIHAFNPLHVAGFSATLTLLRVPLIYRSADAPTRHRWVWRTIWSYVVFRTTRFVAISRFIVDELVSSGVPAQKIALIYGRPAMRALTGQIKASDAKRGRTIAYVGQISQHKGVDLAIEATRALVPEYPDLRLLIAGPISEWDGDAWARALREQVASDPSLAAHVSFLGHVENVSELLGRSDALVVPSTWQEPLGLVVLEAKEAGIPAVIFPRGGLVEMVAHGVDGYVCSDATAPSLIEGLRYYLDSQQRVQDHGRAARQSLSAFGGENLPGMWLSVYRGSETREARRHG